MFFSARHQLITQAYHDAAYQAQITSKHSSTQLHCFVPFLRPSRQITPGMGAAQAMGPAWALPLCHPHLTPLPTPFTRYLCDLLSRSKRGSRPRSNRFEHSGSSMQVILLTCFLPMGALASAGMRRGSHGASSCGCHLSVIYRVGCQCPFPVFDALQFSCPRGMLP